MTNRDTPGRKIVEGELKDLVTVRTKSTFKDPSVSMHEADTFVQSAP